MRSTIELLVQAWASG